MAAHQNEECAGITARLGRVAQGVSQRTEGDREVLVHRSGMERKIKNVGHRAAILNNKLSCLELFI